MVSHLALWAAFTIAIVILLALDLFVFHRRSHTIKIKEALILSGFWIGLALLFDVGIYLWKGYEVALQFLTGYVIEKSLSVDNLFVFVLIFSYFGVPSIHQHKILFWGILGALVMRAVFIFAGVSLIHRFEWIIYLFGALLVFTGGRMMVQKGREENLGRNPIVSLCERFMSVACHSEGGKFFLKEGGRLRVTPLFFVLLAIELSDIVFAVDSIPAILAITTDPFIVYTSNVFAILGLRALYFALAGIVKLFSFLHYGLSLILVFVGAKMLIADFYRIPVVISLAIIVGILSASIILSLSRSRQTTSDKPYSASHENA